MLGNLAKFVDDLSGKNAFFHKANKLIMNVVDLVISKLVC